MRESYGLTPAEARLAQRLVGGSTLLEAADQLRVRPSTARTQPHVRHRDRRGQPSATRDAAASQTRCGYHGATIP